MTGNYSKEGLSQDHRGGWMTVEFILGILVLMVPFMVAIAEVYRVEIMARRLILSAQKESVIRAASLSRNSHYHVIKQSVHDEVDMMSATHRIFPPLRISVELGRTYYVGSGTGRD